MDNPPSADHQPRNASMTGDRRSSELLELIARLESAAGPERELDADIYEFIHNLPVNEISPEFPPRYTFSVDAAMRLLRKHYLWQIKRGFECTAIVWWIEKDWDDTGAPTGYSTAFPALALSTAALIARAVEDRVLPRTPAEGHQT